jgi:hypothetical protein
VTAASTCSPQASVSIHQEASAIVGIGSRDHQPNASSRSAPLVIAAGMWLRASCDGDTPISYPLLRRAISTLTCWSQLCMSLSNLCSVAAMTPRRCAFRSEA